MPPAPDIATKGTDTALSDAQRQAAEADGHCLVIACPGSGKTRLLAARAARLLLANPNGRLVAVTFTREAAQSLRGRIQAVVGRSQNHRVSAGTFHSLALQQLRTGGFGDFRVISDGERYHLVWRAVRESREDVSIDDAISLIESYKASLLPPPTAGPSATIFSIYQDLLAKRKSGDFQDILLTAVRAMRDGRLAPMQVSWLLVDEAQDLDEIQYAWVMAHVSAGSDATLVADDDQCIYGWRFALGFGGLQRFEQDTGAKRYILDVNYRCRPEILAQAVRVIERNPSRFVKAIQPHRDVGGTCELLSYPDTPVEVIALLNRVGESPAGWAVLTRTNRLLDRVEAGLAAQKTPYLRVGDRSVWDRPPCVMYLALANSLAGRDADGYTHVLSRSGIHGAALDQATSLFLDVLNGGAGHLPANGVLQETVVTLVRRFARVCSDWHALVQSGRIDLVLAGTAHWLAANIEERSADLFDLTSSALTRLPGTLAERLTLLSIAKTPPRRQDAVQIMTLHAAKGLEFPCVWIAGADDSHLPHKDGQIDEERRLLYVGMTRAMEHLVISWTQQHGMSRFLVGL